MIQLLEVKNKSIQQKLDKKIKARFSHDYLMGYFETVVWPDGKVYFADYNRILPRYILTPKNIIKDIKTKNIHGMVAYHGVVRGKVVKVNPKNIGKVDFPKGSILVCDNTDVRYLPYMQKATAIITDRGGILSHAAIISRELKTPCIIGTKIATKILRDGDYVEVNANTGIVKKLE